MKVETYQPNRKYAKFAANSTAWQIVATDSTGYDDYDSLILAGKIPFPGTPADFPMGLPKLLARSTTSAGTADGSPFQIKTQGINTPSNGDDLISGSGQTFIFEDDAIKVVWVKKTVGGDIVVLTGYF